MGALLSVLFAPFLMFVNMFFPAGEAVEAIAPQEVNPPYQHEFVMPAVDSPYWEDLPCNHEWQRWKLPKLDLGRVQEMYKALPEDEQDLTHWFRSLGKQITEQDMQFIFLNYPRVAFVYDAELGEFRGITDEGVLHLGFGYNINQSAFYGTRNPWMRTLGYNEGYDKFGNAIKAFNIDTRRVRFFYNDLDYQVQMLKGRYFLDTCVGSEIGFYTKPPSRKGTHYDAYPLEGMMPIGMKLSGGDNTFFDLAPEDHWWSVMMAHRGVGGYQPGDLDLEGSVDFTKDPGLGEAFFAALREQYPEIDAAKEGDLVWFRWAADNQP